MPLRTICAECIAGGTSATTSNPTAGHAPARPCQSHSLTRTKANAVNGKRRRTQAPEVRHGAALGMLIVAIIIAVISANGAKNIAAQTRTTRSLKVSQQQTATPSSGTGFHTKSLMNDPAGVRARAV